MEKFEKKNITYYPVPYLIGTFMLTWCCAVLMFRIDYSTHTIHFTVLDFLENASPLLCALILLKSYWKKERFFRRFFYGKKASMFSYTAVFLLFAAQFLNFYLFRIKDTAFSAHTLLITFMGQFLLGGGLEEAGWRGYLLPCFYAHRHLTPCPVQKYRILISSIGVSIVWGLWHVPYFLLPGSLQAGSSFISYLIIGIITGFILTAIYMLTDSVLLCMLFHSWQNTIVMTIQPDMENIWFMIWFIGLGAAAVLLCLHETKWLERV